MDEQTPKADPVQYERTEDFIDRYANNVRFESSVWDLKIIFGELDQKGGGKEVIHQHTSITLPWPTVKLMLHYLQVNIVFHEAENGRVTIASRMWPPDPRSLPLPKERESDPQAKALSDLLAKIREDFITTLQVSNK